MQECTPTLRELKVYPSFPKKQKLVLPVSVQQRRRKRVLHPLLGVAGFFVVGCALVMGGAGMLMQPMATGATPPPNHAAAVHATVKKVVPAGQPAAVLAQPAPTPPPSWQVVTSQSVPVAQVAAKAAVVVDNQTGDVLLAKDADEPLPMASITKLMTTFVALDRASMDTVITVSANAAATPPTNLPLGQGEHLTVRELIEAMLLPSANDAANALADGLGGQDSFVAAMNAKAAALGLKHTHFADPTGFDAPGHAASATDLAMLAHDLFTAHPDLMAISQQQAISLPASDQHKQYDLTNFHPLVATYPGYLAGKPGFTGDAGMCLLTMAQRGGKTIIAVVLNSPDYASESTALLNAGFAQLGVQ